MNNRTLCLLTFCLGMGLCSFSQNKEMTVEDLLHWQHITSSSVSDDGRWVSARIAPWEGDATLKLYGKDGKEVATFSPVVKSQFSSSSDYILVQLSPGKAVLDSAKLAKVKKNKLPMDKLQIMQIGAESFFVDSLRKYEVSKVADWVAYQAGRKDSTLQMRSLDGKKTFSYPKVSSFGFAEEGDALYYVTKGNEDSEAGLYCVDLKSGNQRLVKKGKGVFDKVSFDKEGSRIAFLYCEDKDSTYKAMDLWLSENNSEAAKVVSRSSEGMPDNWVVSQYGDLWFSESGKRLFFGTSPEPLQKDTTILDEYRPNVQVWSWDEPVQYTVQQYNKEKDLKKNYSAVYLIDSEKMVQLSDKSVPNCTVGNEGDAKYALVSTSEPYSVSSMWEARTRSDYYTVCVETGDKELLSKADYARMRISPEGKYAYWYAETDSSWYAAELESRKINRLTEPSSFVVWDEDFDMPNYPSPYGLAGWTEGDRSLWVYDRYDIWELDPTGERQIKNITNNGREKNVFYSYVKLDDEERSINDKEDLLLKGYNRVSKGYGYYRLKPGAKQPDVIMEGNYMLSSPIKAKDSNALIYTKETYETYPDILLSDMNFRKSVQLTNCGEQQKPFRWGTAELISWTSLDGRKIEGVVYKPVDFDPSRKYPLIVNFYETNSETLYKYRVPQPHRSTVDYRLYNSNEYIVFNPDVRYKDGYPGESCYNCVMPGINKLISEGYINEKAIAAQGHSWGGYQVAYLATRTNLFAAIESGAPVVNMFSAYGGIRWGSGLARSFQYEHTQSRIGGTPWNMPRQYWDNSPLFNMDKVQTPILIMHNDADGHVPWYQGIEYFVAMKRLGKPCWMLNYTGEPHWPLRMANQVDFQKRMLQFFNHFLKKEPMPKWMSDGVKAVEQPYILGY